MAIAPLVKGAVGAALGRLVFEELAEESTPVTSSAIARVGYRQGTIIVTFHQRGTYEFAGSRELYEEFISAPSIGGFFNSHFR